MCIVWTIRTVIRWHITCLYKRWCFIERRDASAVSGREECSCSKDVLNELGGHMLLSYGWEHLHAAVEGIACSRAPLQHRLADAFLNDINLIQECHVPPGVWDRLTVMRGELSKVSPASNENRVIITTSQMSDWDARKWLKEIIQLHEEMCQELARRASANGIHRD